MGVLRRDDISVDANPRPREELTEGAKLVVVLRTGGAFLSELRRGFCGDGAGATTAAGDEEGEFGGRNGNRGTTGFEFGEDGEREREEAEAVGEKRKRGRHCCCCELHRIDAHREREFSVDTVDTSDPPSVRRAPSSVSFGPVKGLFET